MNKYQITLINLSGQKLVERIIQWEEIINTSHLPSGIYFLIIQNNTFEKDTYKIIKRTRCAFRVKISNN